MTADLLSAASSYAALGPGSALARRPRLAFRARPADFAETFDSTTLFYDCFWHDDRQRVVLVGPPWRNLDWKLRFAELTALPSRRRARFVPHHSLSVTVASAIVPEDTTALRLHLDGRSLTIPVQPSETRRLAGARLLFSINRDNDLAWVREWALFHARHHGTNAVILFDNGSTRYSTGELAETLRAVPGLAHVAVPSWPHRFGPIDRAVRTNPFWSRFLQISSMSVVLRRYGERAFGLLDCDIDELAGTQSGRSIYDLAHESPGGLVAFTGQWVEATGGTRHRDFTRRLADPIAARSAPRKWALDPSRAWVRRLSVHPYWHWIEGRDRRAKSMPADAFYWHFKGINTNWKANRTEGPAGAALETDSLLEARFAALAETPDNS